MHITLFGNPVCQIPGYRHFIVNSIPCLKALDNYVITDEERIEDASFGNRFRGLNEYMKWHITDYSDEPSAEQQAQEQANGNSAARGAWMATGITFFVVGVVFTIVMPDNIAGTDRFVQWVARELTTATRVNIMAQYHPEHRALDYPEISRRITADEFDQARAWAKAAGLTHIDL